MNKNDVKTFSYLSYIGPFFLIGLFSDIRKNPTLRFHVNQGLVLFICEVVALIVHSVVEMLLGWIPLIALIPSVLLTFIVLASICMALYGIYNVASDKLNPLPIIGSVSILK